MAEWRSLKEELPAPPVIRTMEVSGSVEKVVVLTDGENFAGTSLPIVLFNGTMATELAVESGSRLRATLPPEVAAPVEVRVITLGGIAKR